MQSSEASNIHPTGTMIRTSHATMQARYGTLESWVSTLAWTSRDSALAVRSALERGDMPLPYGMTLEEATAHWAACIEMYCPLAFMGWRTEPTVEPVETRKAA